MIQELLRTFVRLNAEFANQLDAKDYPSAIKTASSAAQIQGKLRWVLASNASAVESDPLRKFVDQGFLVQTFIAELGLAMDGPDGTPEWNDGYIAEPHLNRVIDFLDPDWAEPVNA